MTLDFGIAFVTGRVQFAKVLKTFFHNWLEHELISSKRIRLHLFVVYDVNYTGAKREDFENIAPEIRALMDSVNVYGPEEIRLEKQRLIEGSFVNPNQCDLIFGDGYGKLRNAAIHFARKQKMDRLLFLDDDEYPVAVVKNAAGNLVWAGQSIVESHIRYGANADMTNGRHCGYISPIPQIVFDDSFTEDDFRPFVEAISNDIVSWDRVRTTTIENQGITYAAGDILDNQWVAPVEEINGMKFISGSNLCFNLQRLRILPVFYNPPGARGEDAFMSTTLSGYKVVRLPCYSFHDAFSAYQHILRGVLPRKLKGIDPRSKVAMKRFLKGTIGWVRYKPLLVYITQRKNYSSIIDDGIRKLEKTIPKLCDYFQNEDFRSVIGEFQRYHSLVEKHFEEFEATKKAWKVLQQREQAGLAASAMR